MSLLINWGVELSWAIMSKKSSSLIVATSSRSSSERDDHLEQELSSPTSETILKILSNRRRQYALHYLLQEDGNAELRELSEQVTAWEHGITPDRVSYDQRRNVYTALKQHHLPSMEDANILVYDDAGGTVELTESMEKFDIYIDIVDRGETIPWNEYYLGLGIVFSISTGLLWIELPPFKYIPPLAWASMIAAIVATSGAVHMYYSRQTQLGADGPPPEVQKYGISKHSTSYLQRLRTREQ